MTRYALGVDLGTTYTAAAVARGTSVEICTLGTTAPQIASIVVLREDGTIVTGEAAERRASSEPTRTAREFKRRLGDPVPIIVGGTPYGAEALMAHLLRAVVQQVAEREDAPPDLVVLTHPANYTDYKRGLLLEAARLAGLDLSTVRLVSEPEAAAIAYASQERVDAGAIVAVYDLGGGTFDAAVVRRTETGFEILGTPEGMERLGGIDFDQAVLAHVDSSLDGMISGADAGDPGVRSSLARLRDDARRAKEALSADTDAAVLVALPGLQTEVRLTREELEAMVRPRVAETVAALQRSIASAGLSLDDVSRVLLVGGSSRMPVVGEEVRRATGRPVTVDAHPKFVIATGAALAGAAELQSDPATAPGVATGGAGLADAAATGTTSTVGLAAAGAAGGAAATVAGHALLRGGSAAPAPTGAAAGPVGVPVTAGPTGVPLTAGPPGVDLAAPTEAIPTPAPEPLAPPRTPGRPRRGIAIGAGAAVGAAAVAAVIVVVGQSGGEDNTAAPPVTTAVVSTTVASPAPTSGSSSSTTPNVVGGRGLDGLVTVVAGNGSDSGEGRPGPAESTSLGNSPKFAVAPNGDVFVTNHENELLLISEGQTQVLYEADTAVGESGFGGVAVGPDGDAYVTMGTGVKRIARDGTSELIVDARALGLRSAFGPITFDGLGNLYFFESSGFRVLRWAAGGGLSVVAGTGTQGEIGSPPQGDGGPAVAASLTGGNGMVIDADGALLLAEGGRGVVRRIAPDGTITTIAGGGSTILGASGTYAADGTKPTDLELWHASDVVIDAAGRIYVCDDGNHAIFRFEPGGGIELLGADQTGAVADFGIPANAFRIRTVDGLAVDASGDLLFHQDVRIFRIADASDS